MLLRGGDPLGPSRRARSAPSSTVSNPMTAGPSASDDDLVSMPDDQDTATLDGHPIPDAARARIAGQSPLVSVDLVVEHDGDDGFDRRRTEPANG